MRLRAYAWVGLLVCASGALAIDTPDSVFQSLYGAKLLTVQRTKETTDDLALAKDLLTQSADIATEPALQAIMYVHAADLALADPAGEKTADDAVAALRQLDPVVQSSADELLLSLLDKRYAGLTGARRKPVAGVLLGVLSAIADTETTANHVSKAVSFSQRAAKVAQVVGPAETEHAQERLKMLTARQNADARAQTLAKTASTDPKAAGDLVLLLLVDLDRPQDAAQYVDSLTDPELAEIAKLAGKKSEELSEDDALNLAKWYRSVAEKAAEPRLPLLRARDIYERFLASHTTENLKRLAARVGLDATIKALGKIAITNKDRAACDAQLTVQGNNPHGDKFFGESITFEKRGSIWVGREMLKRREVIILHPLTEQAPSTLDFSALTTQGAGTLVLEYHSAPGCDCVIVVKLDGKEIKRAPVAGDAWKTDRFPFHGQHLTVENWASGWFNEHLILTYHIE